jgi:hypothetical protein
MSMGRSQVMIGPTSRARYSFGSQPVGMNNAVIKPQAIKAPMFGITIALRKRPADWTDLRKSGRVTAVAGEVMGF